jgi:hypothetical protein
MRGPVQNAVIKDLLAYCEGQYKTPSLQIYWHTHLPVFMCVLYSVSVPQTGRISPFYRFPYYFWQWQLITYWDFHLELIPRPRSARNVLPERL